MTTKGREQKKGEGEKKRKSEGKEVESAVKEGGQGGEES